MSEHEWPKSIETPDLIQRLAADVGGDVKECALLPDGSGFAIMSMPLPKDHWSLVDKHDVPPMPFRVGMNQYFFIDGLGLPGGKLSRQQFADMIRAAGRYAYRASTMNGKEPDLDPDALLQNLVVGFLGYWTETGLSSDEWENPPRS